MKTIMQFFALLELSLSSLKDRLGSVLVTVIGTACVVGVLISMLSIGAGARAMIMHNARADRVWVLKHGSPVPCDPCFNTQTRVARYRRQQSLQGGGARHRRHAGCQEG